MVVSAKRIVLLTERTTTNGSPTNNSILLIDTRSRRCQATVRSSRGCVVIKNVRCPNRDTGNFPHRAEVQNPGAAGVSAAGWNVQDEARNQHLNSAEIQAHGCQEGSNVRGYRCVRTAVHLFHTGCVRWLFHVRVVVMPPLAAFHRSRGRQASDRRADT